MEIFRRRKDYSTEWDEQTQRMDVTVTMVDRFHDMGVTVTFTYPDLVIAAVTSRMTRTPYPVCPGALAAVQACAGMKVQAGLQLMLQRRAGGARGCTHLTQLVLDACHGAVQGLLAMASQRESQPGQLPAQAKIDFLEERDLSIRDSCLAYATPAADPK